MPTKPTHSTFKFRTTDSIGAAAAEDDRDFLSECFVDTGDLALLKDVRDNRLIVMGRTGAGKSAILSVLEKATDGRVIRISPEQLALSYVSNSTILSFFEGLGVNLDPFFKLLWRHIFTVEILNRHFDQTAESPPLLDRLRELFLGASKKDTEMKQAIHYLEQWGKTFWQETDFRVREITSTFEKDLDAEAKATLGPKAAAITVGGMEAERFSATERAELVTRGQSVVTRAQVEDLSKVLKMLDMVLDDRQQHYYIVIDGLDENWVEERLRYRLIMALLQAAREFLQVRNAKIIVALRRDLIERVFRLARDAGFQEEKYQSLYLPLVWTRAQIVQLLDRRIAFMVTRRYAPAANVTHRDLLPKEFRKQPIADYIYSIARRPRDVIAWFNACIGAAPDQARLGARELRLAEGEYSRQRLRALGDEWSADYPSLLDFAAVLQRRPAAFKAKTIDEGALADVCLKVATERPEGGGILANASIKVADAALPVDEFRLQLIRAFYQVGLVGLKRSPYEAVSWADELGKSVSAAELTAETGLVVHPAYRRALGVAEA